MFDFDGSFLESKRHAFKSSLLETITYPTFGNGTASTQKCGEKDVFSYKYQGNESSNLLDHTSRDKEGTCTRSRTCTTMVFLVFNLGILGDNLPINSHYIGLL